MARLSFTFGGTQTAQHVLKNRYLLPSESPDQLVVRVAKAVAAAETNGARDTWAEQFAEAMRSGKFCPNTPTLVNAGKKEGQLAACFVLPVEDDIREIFETLKNAAWIQQSGGGTGFSFGHLRPKGDVVQSTHGTASGPINFLRVFDQATESIKQGGARRGANMGILPASHPDVVEFVSCKATEGVIRNFNISVAAPAAFMKAAEAGEPWELLNPRTGRPVRKVPARDLLKTICHNAWLNGEPGLVFIDRVNEDNPTPELGPIESTNPCGEQPLLPFEACNLGSINIAAFVDQKTKQFNWDAFQETISLGVRFLDDVIDVNHYPLPQIEQRVRLNRKIGLGLMGLADAFLIMELTYDDAAALAFAEKLATFFGRHAREASEELGKERGFYPQTAQLGHKNTQPPRRNACVTTVAPTGTISLLCGCSPGIEPVYSFITQRNILSGKPVVDLHPYFEAICSDEKISLSDTLDWLGRQTHTSLNTYEKISANIRRLLKTATAIDWKTHIDMQAIFQNHVDNGVSKTINLATSATEQTIWDAYMYAFHKRCKGITVYRHRSRKQQSQTLPSPVHETCGTPLIAREGCLYCPQCSISLCGTE